MASRKRTAAAGVAGSLIFGFLMTMGAGPSAPPAGGGGEPAAGEANIWVESGAGACAGGRSSTPIAYAASASPDRRCGTFDAAWDAMSAGDTARVVAGTYPIQCLTGNKASDTKIIGEGDGNDVTVQRDSDFECVAVSGGGSGIGVSAAHVWLENMTVDTLDELHGYSTGSGIRCYDTADDLTLVDVNIDGNFATLQVECDNLSMTGGRIRDDPNPTQWLCEFGIGHALQLEAPGAVIDGVTFGRANQIDVPEPNNPPCGEDGIPHIETVRISPEATPTIIRNSVFVKGSEIGSGHIFFGTNADTRVLHLINNYFGESADNANILQLNGLSTSSVFAYNTFDPNAGFASSTYANIWVGNIGESFPCAGTHTKNVQQGSGSCGTDTFIGATDLGVDDTGNLEAGSPAIDAGETPGASDYCTDSSYVNSVDFEGTVRPQNSVCDAGADEYTP